MKEYLSQNATAATSLEQHMAAYRVDLPLRMEMDAIARVLSSLDMGTYTCLDAGFDNPVSSQALRKLGGFWSSVVWSAAQREQASALLDEEVFQAGAHNELPYEDKQFDVVVLGRGRLGGDRAADELLVQECHRVLKTPGYLIICCNYRKPAGLAALFGRRFRLTQGTYNESQIFDLLKTGFDVLSVKTFCRFWVYLTRRLFERPDRNPVLINIIFRIAYQLDLLLFFTKGYQLLAYGRRKGWHPRQAPILSDGRNLGEAVLRRSNI